MEVIKPKKVFFAMCVYKFTLDTGFYYYGATTDLGARISRHVTSTSPVCRSGKMLQALNEAKWIKFEIVRFVNDRNKLKAAEEFYLKKHVGKKKCLNQMNYCTSPFSKDGYNKKIPTEPKTRDGKVVFQYDTSMNFIKKFNSVYQASKAHSVDRSDIRKVLNNKRKTCKGYIFKLESEN